MDMRRLNARNYAVYLQRRVEDFIDPARPLPKWTDLDRAYDLAAANLHENRLPVPLPQDEEAGDEMSAWVIEPQPAVPFAPAKRPWWQVWRRESM